MRTLVRVVLVMAGIAVLSGGLVRPVFADGVVGHGTPVSCSEAEFTTVLALGGKITFDCGGAATIPLTSAKTISIATTLDGGNLITLSGGDKTQLFVVGQAASLTLTNITLTDGFANADGGAIDNKGTLVLNHSTIVNSRTSYAGSGGALVTYGPLTITDSTLAGNSAANGGALYIRGGSTTITNSVLRGNATTGTDGWGGAMLLWAGVRVDMTGGEIANNTALFGGGIHNRFATSTVTLRGGTSVHDNVANDGGGIYNVSGTTTLTNVTLQGNKAIGQIDGNGGGGIDNASGTTTLTSVTLRGNSSARTGGGIYTSGTTTLTRVMLQGNTATAGGGITTYGTTTLLNVTLQGNTATTGGGGIFNVEGSATLTNVTLQGNSATTGGGGFYNGYGMATLTNVTLQGNTATTGGGIWNTNDASTSLYLENVVVADSTSGGNCDFRQAPDSVSFSLSTDTSCALGGTSNRTNTPALLGPLQDNGGGIVTMLPQATSPLIDRGQCRADVPTDERGVARPQGPACDIGAVEVQPSDQQQHIYLPFVVS